MLRRLGTRKFTIRVAKYNLLGMEQESFGWTVAQTSGRTSEVCVTGRLLEVMGTQVTESCVYCSDLLSS